MRAIIVNEKSPATTVLIDVMSAALHVSAGE
jgi:hypothetical protein